ncbi:MULTISPECIES: hypothetical protein [Halobacterium]|uniref:hypothetical protein n=1 Tax=Halobacterium TaxID=2239 RepID=UPI00073F9995|nr:MULTISPECIES: hypothetical protein [Halobacterium]MCG1004565.1 hypothetical protein [Halobacterium noricense]
MQQLFADTLDVYGVLVGVFVALVGIATLVGMPWQYTNSGVVTVLQALGALGAVGIGAGLAWLAHAQTQ